MWSSAIFFIAQLLISLTLVSSNENGSSLVTELISKGDRFRASGKTKHALQAYDDAIKLDPTNYLVLFKRGAVYMSIPGKEASAISDLGKVLKIRPSFSTALKQRCGLF